MNIKLTNVDRIFRLYKANDTKMESTFFDLISGDTETKQTKGLAYVMKIIPDIISEILKLNEVNSILKRRTDIDVRKLVDCDLIAIDAEKLSQGKHSLRRDITITFYKNNEKNFVLVIEAKSIKEKNIGDIEAQLKKYFDPALFPSDYGVPNLGISLTKQHYLFSESKNCVSITWSQIIEIINNILSKNIYHNKLQHQLLNEYHDFLMEVENGVKFYEKEVLSVPAGKTIQHIIKHHIHACPNNKSHSYRTPLYITFRKTGGIMDALYQIEDIIVFNPNNPSYIDVVENSNLVGKTRILKYTEERSKNKFGFEKKDCDYRFYILSEKRTINLPHKPRIEKLSGHCYFSFSELLSGKINVIVESKE